MFRLLLLPSVLVLVSLSHMEHLTLSDHGKSSYSIVVSSEAIQYDQKAAEEFQKYFERISGVRLPIITDESPASEFEILIGNDNRLVQTGLQEKIANLDEDGFIIRTM
ncbi:MAG: hypothetical protein FJY07_04250, partial [Bacteroidetes bacterium]|nr:hypothetical protein [Bacteroidota bacterium]